MATSNFTIDYRGARGSNAGDEYHELWAVRQALRLLDEHSPLSGMTLEGLRADDGIDSVWDGVDCALFYGGTDSAHADKIEIQQLKYSAANPSSPWTVARMSTGRKGKASTSPIRRLANAYARLVEKRLSKPTDSLKIAFVTNQPIDAALIDLIGEAQVQVPSSFAKAWKSGGADLHRLVHASGLKPDKFQTFARVLDLRGNSGSRFASEEEMLRAIAEWTDVEFSESASRLRTYVRTRMLPESAGEFIDREKVLIQFGVSYERSLFPCPTVIRKTTSPVVRAAAKEAVDRMRAGQQHLCLHGLAGVGKTTALQEIGELLPAGSVMVIFDCYGGGSYMDASALRHKPEDAFLQLSNDLARQLHLPLLLEPRGRQDFARAFRKRLDQTAKTLQLTRPGAMILVAIDAADNSVTAAETRSPPDRTFVHEFVSFSNLPPNVHFLVSARSGRRRELQLPRAFEQVELLAFTPAETAVNVARYWQAPADWTDDFHHLSNGVPRVQAYAFDSAGDRPELAINALRPLGKNLEQVFGELFDLALKKAGRSGDLTRVCAGLIALARPIPITHLAAVLEFDEAQIADICADLAPGVRNEAGLLSFADEDFEAFVREAGDDAMGDILQRTADHFLQHALTDSYAAYNVAPALLAAKRGKALLDFVEQTSEPAATLIRDPISRREVQLQRLLTAIKACRESGDPARALRFVLIGAEAIGTEKATRSLLTAYPELTARYAKETASRLILGDPELIEDHGRLLAQLLAQDAAKGDAIAFREGRRRFAAWLQARHDDIRKQEADGQHVNAWEIDEEAGAASIYATLLLDGAGRAASRIATFRSARFALGSAKILIERLLAERRFDDVTNLAAAVRPAWAVFALVPLAMAGKQIDIDKLSRGLRDLKRRFVLDANTLGSTTSQHTLGPYVIDVALCGAEILAARHMEVDTVNSVLGPFLDPELRRIDRRHDFETNLLDAILRSYCLSEMLEGRNAKEKGALTARPPVPPDKENRRHQQTDGQDHDRHLSELIDSMMSFYVARARAIVGVSSGADSIDADLSNAQGKFASASWRFERRDTTSSAVRAKIAESLTLLIAVGANPDSILSQALKVRQSIWPIGESGVRNLFTRLTAIQDLHARLLTEITNAVGKARRERTGAEDKSRALASYAKLLLPISSEDADEVFKKAIEVAGEVDSEVMDQLKFMAVLIDRAVSDVDSDALGMARGFSEIVGDAGIRLENVDHFPWNDAFRGLALLDFSTALAAAARWDDTNTVGLHLSIAPIVGVGVEKGNITRMQAMGILQLLERANDDDLQCVLHEGADAHSVAEELARDVIGDRIAAATEVAEFVGRNRAGQWTDYFIAQQEFERALQSESANAPKESSPLKPKARPILEAHVWTDATLVDADLLAEVAEDVLNRARSAGEYLSMGDVLKQARAKITVGNRIAHLNALASLSHRPSTHRVIDEVVNAIEEWSAQNAVRAWSNAHMPELIAASLPDLARYLPWRQGPLKSALVQMQANDSEIQAVLLDGIERNTDSLGQSAIFALAGEIASRLEATQAASLCKWYIERLSGRIESEYLERIPADAIPADAEEAVARFIFAYLGEIDVRLRWRAAHALRRLARLDATTTLTKVVNEHGRRRDIAFRDPAAPYYWIASNLWLVIALDRIVLETPKAAAPHGNWLLDVALSDSFPHLLLRDYAADACRKLIARGLLTPSDEQASELKTANRTRLPIGRKKRTYGRTFNGARARSDTEKRRFHFDGLDTLRYWYEPWLRAFQDLSPEAFLDAAESWIVDRWGVQDEPPYGSKEPRTRRFNDYNWTLSNTSHGTLPTLERHRAYLEWHAMWCAAGEVLHTHRVARREYRDDDEVRAQLSYNKLSDPEMWAADLVGPRPLEAHFWSLPSSGPEWFEDVSDELFLQKLLPLSRPGYITVSASIVTKWERREEAIQVNSGLVSRETAHALVRALQTIENSHDYYLCPEGDDLEIDERDYTLKGWLKRAHGDSGFDRRDSFSNELSRVDPVPGKRVSAHLGLERKLGAGYVAWMRRGETEPSFIYEAWGPRQRNDRRDEYSEESGSRGERLLIRASDLGVFLSFENFHLVAEVGVTRSDKTKRRYAHDEEEAQDAEFDRVFLLKADGGIEAAERGLGAWR